MIIMVRAGASYYSYVVQGCMGRIGHHSSQSSELLMRKIAMMRPQAAWFLKWGGGTSKRHPCYAGMARLPLGNFYI